MSSAEAEDSMKVIREKSLKTIVYWSGVDVVYKWHSDLVTNIVDPDDDDIEPEPEEKFGSQVFKRSETDCVAYIRQCVEYARRMRAEEEVEEQEFDSVWRILKIRFNMHKGPIRNGLVQGLRDLLGSECRRCHTMMTLHYFICCHRESSVQQWQVEFDALSDILQVMVHGKGVSGDMLKEVFVWDSSLALKIKAPEWSRDWDATGFVEKLESQSCPYLRVAARVAVKTHTNRILVDVELLQPAWEAEMVYRAGMLLFACPATTGITKKDIPSVGAPIDGASYLCRKREREDDA
jgi:hypothetical protein